VTYDRAVITGTAAAVNCFTFTMSTSRPTTGARLLRFGLFEVDLLAGELRKQGNRVRLQEQPFQVLAALLQAPGEVISRDQLREKIWPADTFVDFDHSLNTAINKIREALGDSASNPRFVETLARRGYRFIAPVTVQTAPGTNQGLLTPSESPASIPPAVHPDLDVPIPHRGLTRGLFLLIQAMYLVFYVEALIHVHGVSHIIVENAPGWAATLLMAAIVITAGAGIPVRCYLISAAAFDHRKLGDKFRRLYTLLLPLDSLWALAPFLIIEKIGIGGALAATAALIYVPFSERTLIRLAYPSGGSSVQNPGT
jgi:DNA-binding winged helix-turn-helix (wHTH) protein